jgi:hypothetical protein
VQQLDGNNIGLSYIQQAGDTSAITSGSQYAGEKCEEGHSCLPLTTGRPGERPSGSCRDV